MTSLQSFPLFPELIPELRLQIWQCALEIPRLVVVWKHESRGSDYVRRSVSSSLLAVCWEARREALRYYSSPQTGTCTLPPSLPPPIQSGSNPYYIGPGTDILYLSGSDPLHRRYKPLSWICVYLARDLESSCPTFAPIRHLAVDEVFLRSTPFFQFSKMPYSIWKLVISDLRALETIYVVRREGKFWGKKEVERALAEAKGKFMEYLLCAWGDEVEKEEIMGWSLPEVRMVTFEELVGRCWTPMCD